MYAWPLLRHEVDELLSPLVAQTCLVLGGQLGEPHLFALRVPVILDQAS